MYYVLSLFIYLKIFQTYHTKDVMVERTKDFDEFTPIVCSNVCEHTSNSFCSVSGTQCCDICRCHYGKTLYQTSNQASCINDPGHQEKCIYQFLGSEYATQNMLSVKLTANSDIRIGVIVTLKTTQKQLRECTLETSKSVYWNTQAWLQLFTDGRKSSDFFFSTYGKKQTALKVDIQGVSVSSYDGLLIKLQIKCTDESNTRIASCLMFKVVGKTTYEIVDNQVTTAEPVWSTLSTAPTPAEDSHHIIIIIMVVLLLIVLVVAAILIFLWRRRRNRDNKRLSFIRNSNQHSRKFLLKKNQKDDDVLYQAPEQQHPNGKTDQNDFGNPTYLTPVDKSNTPLQEHDGVYHDPSDVMIKDRSIKDPKYDYPQLEILPIKKNHKDKPGDAITPTRHVYADITTDGYIDPDVYIEKRKEKLPSTGYASIDDNDNKESKPKSCNGYTSLKDGMSDDKPENTGYAELDSTLERGSNYQLLGSSDSPTSPTNPNYFELEKGDI